MREFTLKIRYESPENDLDAARALALAVQALPGVSCATCKHVQHMEDK